MELSPKYLPASFFTTIISSTDSGLLSFSISVSLIKRNLRPAKDLLGYSLDKIEKTMKNFKNIDYLSKWTLETVVKYIDEPEKPSNDIERDLIKKDLAGDMDNLNAGSRSAKRLGISFEEAMVLNKDLLK